MTNTNDSNVPATTQANGVMSADDIALLEGATQTKDFKQEDLLIPYLLIVQATSGFIVRNDPDFIDGARPGDILDTLTRDPAQRVAIVPVKYEVTYSEWKPNRGGLIKQWGTDPSRYDSATGEFGTKKTPDGNDIVPAATYYGLRLFPDGATMPVVIRMTGSQYKKSRRLNTLIDMLEVRRPDGTILQPPMYARAYSFETVGESNDQGSWHGWKIEPAAMLLQIDGGKAVFQKADKLRQQIDAGTARAAPVNATVERTINTDAAAGQDEIPF